MQSLVPAAALPSGAAPKIAPGGAPIFDLLPMARDFNIGVTAWAPLGMGVLTGKYSKTNRAKAGGRLEGAEHSHLTGFMSDRSLAIADKVQELADEFGHTPSQIALSWLRHKGVIPIIGARKAAQIVENLGCVDINLTAEQVRTLDEASKVDLGFVHDFIQGDATRDLIFGDTLSRVETAAAKPEPALVG